jgi:hypothetical protein
MWERGVRWVKGGKGVYQGERGEGEGRGEGGGSE